MPKTILKVNQIIKDLSGVVVLHTISFDVGS
jgi:hypothetical protein